MQLPRPVFAPSYRHLLYHVSTQDHWTLAVQAFVPKRRRFPFVVLCLHGFAQSHLSWTVGPFVRRLCDEGIEVHLLDWRGHGLSSLAAQGQKGPLPRDLHYGWNIDAYFRYDLPATLACLQEKWPERPVVLCGHSLGGMLAACYALDAPESIAGLVALAAPLEPACTSGRVHLTSRVLAPLRWLRRHLPTQRAPLDLFFGALDLFYFGTQPGVAEALPWLVRHDRHQVISRLWNPFSTEPALARTILQNSEPEAAGVIEQLIRWVRGNEISFGASPRTNYLTCFHKLSLPVLTANGDEDLLAPPATVEGFHQEIQSPYRQHLLLRQTNHIDITSGRPALHVCEALLALLEHLDS